MGSRRTPRLRMGAGDLTPPVDEMISVVIPAYDAEDYIEDCVKSVSQQAGVAEIIVVDDCSVDRTIDIVRSLAETDSRVKIVLKEHGGVAAARNVGLTLASAPYLAFVDADDVLPENAFRCLFEAAYQFDSDMVYGDFSILRDGEIEPGPNELYGFRPGRISVRDAVESLASTSSKSISGSCWRVLYRVSFLKENSLSFPEGIAMSEDYYFILDCLRASPKIAYTNECVYLVRRGGVSVTQRFMPSLESDMNFVNEHLRLLSEGDATLMAYYFENDANAAWCSCRNLYRSGSPFGLIARQKYVESTCRRHSEALRSISLRGSMPNGKVALLKIGRISPAVFWLALELMKFRLRGK